MLLLLHLADPPLDSLGFFFDLLLEARCLRLLGRVAHPCCIQPALQPEVLLLQAADVPLLALQGRGSLRALMRQALAEIFDLARNRLRLATLPLHVTA